jgi:hypothetical protein
MVEVVGMQLAILVLAGAGAGEAVEWLSWFIIKLQQLEHSLLLVETVAVLEQEAEEVQ